MFYFVSSDISIEDLGLGQKSKSFIFVGIKISIEDLRHVRKFFERDAAIVSFYVFPPHSSGGYLQS